MFIGHMAVGFATKRFAPETSLGWHVLAPNLLDILFPIFVLMGLDHLAIVPGYTAVSPLDLHDFPWSHSLVMSLVWSALYAGVFFALKRNARTALLLAVGVFSHFILDFVTHRPEMQLYPGSVGNLGLNLWASVPGTLAVELAMTAVGVGLYVQGSKPTKPSGTWSMVAFLAVLMAAYLLNIFGPPPPSANFVVVGILALLPVVPWASAFDQRRTFSA